MFLNVLYNLSQIMVMVWKYLETWISRFVLMLCLKAREVRARMCGRIQNYSKRLLMVRIFNEYHNISFCPVWHVDIRIWYAVLCLTPIVAEGWKSTPTAPGELVQRFYYFSSSLVWLTEFWLWCTGNLNIDAQWLKITSNYVLNKMLRPSKLF